MTQHHRERVREGVGTYDPKTDPLQKKRRFDAANDALNGDDSLDQ